MIKKRFILSIVFFALAISGYAQTFTFGTYPFDDLNAMYQGFLPLARKIAEETDWHLDLVVTRDYAELSERLTNGTVDIAWIGSANYIKTKQALPGIEYVATYQEWDSSGKQIEPYYQSMILTLRTASYRSLSDLKQARFAFTDKDSTSGYVYPRMMLLEDEIEPAEFFRKVFFLGKHQKVIEALLAGSIDAGAVSDRTYYLALKEHGDVFRILASSPPIPLDAVVTRPGIPDEIVSKLQTVLLSIEPDDSIWAGLKNLLGWPAAGFAVKDDSFYDSIRNVLSFKGR